MRSISNLIVELTVTVNAADVLVEPKKAIASAISLAFIFRIVSTPISSLSRNVHSLF